MRALFLVLLTLTLGCATSTNRTSSTPGGISDSDYDKLVKRYTQKTNQYDGFYQTFQADMTMLATDLRTAGVARQGDYQQWDPARLQKERDSAFQQMAAQTEFFLRFFTPDNDNDDLATGKSIWRLYLDVGGKRYEGEVKKLNWKISELKNLYPNYDRFSTPYQVTFKVPTAAVESTSAKVILTSIMGTAEFSFPTTK